MIALTAIAGVYLIILLIVIATSVFWIVEIIDVCRRQFYDPTMKLVWLLIIIFSHIIGSLIYYFMGKKDGLLPGETQYGR